jgi:5-methylcytosine-specific restriction endonuclease McrA
LCAEVKSIETGFHRNRSTRDGRAVACKECACAHTREWGAKNSQRASASAKQWRLDNLERHRETAKKWRQANPEKVREGKRRAKAKWRREKPQEVLMARRLEMKARRPRGPERRDTIDYMAILDCDPCSYCGESSNSADHIVPVSAGGSVSWENLTGACRSCNSRKQKRPLLTYLLERVESPV